jgi:hypothetical protein
MGQMLLYDRFVNRDGRSEHNLAGDSCVIKPTVKRAMVRHASDAEIVAAESWALS